MIKTHTFAAPTKQDSRVIDMKCEILQKASKSKQDKCARGNYFPAELEFQRSFIRGSLCFLMILHNVLAHANRPF